MQQQLKKVVTGSNLNNFLFRKFDKILSVLLFLYCAALPFEEALASDFGSILRWLGILIIGYCLIVYCGYKISISNFRLLVPFAFWLLFAVFSVMWSADFSWWRYFTQIYLLQFAFVIFVVGYYKRINISYLQNGLVVGAMIASVILIFMPQVSQFTEDGRRTVIVLGQELDPNIVASIIMLGVFSCLGRIFAGEKKGILYKILLLVMGCGMLFTGSRGALISFVLGLGILSFFEMRERGTRKRVLVMIVIFTIMALIALSYMPQELLVRFSTENIFGLDEYERGVHNRYTIWLHAFELFVKSPIIGYGSGNFFSAIDTVYKECASHNMYILILIEEGVIGLSMFGYGLLKIFRQLYIKRLYTQLAMFASVCVMAMTLDSITYKYFWISLIMVILSIHNSAPKRK